MNIMLKRSAVIKGLCLRKNESLQGLRQLTESLWDVPDLIGGQVDGYWIHSVPPLIAIPCWQIFTPDFWHLSERNAW